MGRTQYYAAASLDGYIADPDGGLEWLNSYSGESDAPGAVPGEGTYERFYADVGAVAMGSRTYEFLLGEVSEWPYAGRPTWVFSRRDVRPFEGAEELRFESGDVASAHAEMAAAAGERNIWIVGGGDLASQFAAADLLDELILTVVPVVLGEGRPLFRASLERPLRLTAARPFTSGMVELRYDLASA